MNKTIVVTGGHGYVGSLLCWMLIKSGLKVVVFDKGFYGNFVKSDPNFAVIFDNYETFMYYFEEEKEQIQTVIHLGGISNDPMANWDPKINSLINTEFTRKFAENLLQIIGFKGKFIYASTASVYGCNGELANENSDVNPNSAYAKSKYDSEIILTSLFKDTDVILTILRKATIMGGSIRNRLDLVVNTMIASAYKNGVIKLYNGGEIWRPLVHVYDVVKCYVQMATTLDEFSGIWNLVHKNYRISELGLYIKFLVEQKLNKVVNIESCYNIQDNRSYLLDGNKLTRAGFIPELGVAKAVDEIIEGLDSKKIDINDPIHYNIKWLKNCERVSDCLKIRFNLLDSMGIVIER